MTPEERERTIEFILQNQADAAVRMQRIEEQQRQFQILHEREHERLQREREIRQVEHQKEHEESLKEIEEFKEGTRQLWFATQNLLEVVTANSRRLDHLEEKDRGPTA